MRSRFLLLSLFAHFVPAAVAAQAASEPATAAEHRPVASSEIAPALAVAPAAITANASPSARLEDRRFAKIDPRLPLGRSLIVAGSAGLLAALGTFGHTCVYWHSPGSKIGAALSGAALISGFSLTFSVPLERRTAHRMSTAAKVGTGTGLALGTAVSMFSAALHAFLCSASRDP